MEQSDVCFPDTRSLCEHSRQSVSGRTRYWSQAGWQDHTPQRLSQAERTYVTLDDPLVLSLAKTDPALFMQRFPPPVLIDEIQYAPELLPYIKMAADRTHHRVCSG